SEISVDATGLANQLRFERPDFRRHGTLTRRPRIVRQRRKRPCPNAKPALQPQQPCIAPDRAVQVTARIVQMVTSAAGPCTTELVNPVTVSPAGRANEHRQGQMRVRPHRNGLTPNPNSGLACGQAVAYGPTLERGRSARRKQAITIKDEHVDPW